MYLWKYIGVIIIVVGMGGREGGSREEYWETYIYIYTHVPCIQDLSAAPHPPPAAHDLGLLNRYMLQAHFAPRRVVGRGAQGILKYDE